MSTCVLCVTNIFQQCYNADIISIPGVIHILFQIVYKIIHRRLWIDLQAINLEISTYLRVYYKVLQVVIHNKKIFIVYGNKCKIHLL